MLLYVFIVLLPSLLPAFLLSLYLVTPHAGFTHSMHSYFLFIICPVPFSYLQQDELVKGRNHFRNQKDEMVRLFHFSSLVTIYVQVDYVFPLEYLEPPLYLYIYSYT